MMQELDTEYFRSLKQTAEDKLEELNASLRPHAPLEKGHEVPVDEVIKRNADGSLNQQSTLGKLVALLEQYEWTFKIGKSRVFTGDKLIKTSQTVKPGKEADHIWVQAINGGHRIMWNKEYSTLDGAEAGFDELRAFISKEEQS